MAVHAVTLAESLRTWRWAGIWHVLGDDTALPQESTLAANTKPVGIPAVAPQNERTLHESSSVPEARPAHQHSPSALQRKIPERDAPVPSTPPGSPSTRPSTPPSNVEVSRTHTPTPPSTTPPEARPSSTSGLAAPTDWPLPWQELWERTRPAPVLWTYEELGDDLTGKGDNRRSACLKSLIAEVALPRGSSVFWPPRLATSGDEALAEGLFFRSGLERLNPKAVVLLGERAAELSGLDLHLRIPFTQQVSQGRLFVLLPEFSGMLRETSFVSRAAVFLRAAFASWPGLIPKPR